MSRGPAVGDPAVLLELRRLTREQRERDEAIDGLIGAARAAGSSWRQLAAAMGITDAGVRLRARRHGIGANGAKFAELASDPRYDRANAVDRQQGESSS